MSSRSFKLLMGTLVLGATIVAGLLILRKQPPSPGLAAVAPGTGGAVSAASAVPAWSVGNRVPFVPQAAPGVAGLIGGPAATIDPQGQPWFAGLAAGATITLPLPNGEEVRGQVNLVMPPSATANITRIAGGLVGRPGSFSLSMSASGMGGRILLPDTGRACELEPDAGGGAVIREHLLADVLCYRLPPGPEGPLGAPPEGPLAAPPILSSRPTATAVLYLDFDGEVVTDPDWNNGQTIVAAPANLINAQITRVWNMVKEDYAPFDIDVTTDPTRYANAPVGRRMRCIITPTNAWYGASGGVAYRNSFRLAGTTGFSTTVPCWVFNTTTATIAEAVSHELGHTLGLKHDGDSTQPEGSTAREYYQGHGGDVEWGSIMGSSYFRTLVQWSKGEYPGANNFEDDLAIISDPQNGFGYVPDEAGDTPATAVVLGTGGASFTQAGIIHAATDVDFYRISLAASTALTLDTSLAPISPNLDLLLELQDAGGAILGRSNPVGVRGGSLSMALGAGDYYVKIRGVGGGTSVNQGYSAYGSIGAYSLSGSFGAALPPTIVSEPSASATVAGASLLVSIAAEGTEPLTYRWKRNGVDLANAGHFSGVDSPTLFISPGHEDDTGTYSVTVANSAGAAATTGVMFTFFPSATPFVNTLSKDSMVGLGQTTSLDVTVGGGSGPIQYRWSKDEVVLPGATQSSYVIPSAQAGDAGSYTVEITNAGGTIVSRPVRLYVTNSAVLAVHEYSVPGYVAGRAFAINNSLLYVDSPGSVKWEVLLPAGWIYLSDDATSANVQPVARDTGLLEWTWNNVPAGPIKFSYAVSVPADQVGDVPLVARVALKTGGNLAEWLAQPDPLVVKPKPASHSADTNQDFRLTLLELTRVIELYNTRFGTTRTGNYGVASVATEDGFFPDAGRPNTAVETLPRYHSADVSRDGKLSLLELTRVIELYNYRSGSTRTGQYRSQTGTEDGFAAGP